MIRALFQHTIGTKAFLYLGAFVVLIAWLIYFRIIHFQYWLQSDWNVFLSALVLIAGEGLVLFLYELFRDKKEETKSRRSITRLPIYDDIDDRDHTIIDTLKEEVEEEEKIALWEGMEKEEEHGK